MVETRIRSPPRNVLEHRLEHRRHDLPAIIGAHDDDVGRRAGRVAQAGVAGTGRSGSDLLLPLLASTKELKRIDVEEEVAVAVQDDRSCSSRRRAALRSRLRSTPPICAWPVRIWRAVSETAKSRLVCAKPIMATSARPNVSRKNGIATSANSTAAMPRRARPKRRNAFALCAATRANIPPPERASYARRADIPSNESVNAR